MVRKKFDASFERLRDQSNRLADIDRSGDNFDEIVEERVELDRLRDETTKERKTIVSRYEPPAPDVVPAPRGYVNTQLFGKIAAGVSVVLLIVAGFFVFRIARSFTTQFPLEFVDVTESIIMTPACQWQLHVSVRNDSDERVQIERVETVRDRIIARATVFEVPPLAPGETAILTAAWNLANADECGSVDEVDHGNLILYLDNGAKVSRGI